MFYRRERLTRSDADRELSKKAARRIRGMSTNLMLNHLDAVFSGMQRGLEDFREDGDLDALGEISVSLITVEAMVRELIIRRSAELGF